MFSNKTGKRLALFGMSSVLAASSFIGLGTNVVNASDMGGEVPNEEMAQKKGPENIILLIGDGMGPSAMTALRYMNDSDPETSLMEDMAFDPHLVGMQTTSSDDHEENIPDSAATATSMAAGIKTYNGAISVDKDKSPVGTVLEQAKEKNMSTGLVTTVQINHATPAAFGAHNESRKNYDEIADDYYDEMINGEHKIDVMLGGGMDFFVRDDRNLAEEFENDGYGYVTNRDELLADDNDKILGLFAPVAIPKMIDRTEEDPSLKELTTAALERLNKDEDGFFLMVEGSQIDWAEHDNDIVGAMSEMQDFEAAFQTAIDFAEADGNTLVVATADHATGGLSVGRGSEYVWNQEIIKQVKRSPDYMAERIAEGEDIKETLASYIEFDLTDEEIQSVIDAKENATEEDLEEDVDDAIELIIDVRSNTGWTTSGHTGVDVPVYAYGPEKDMFAGRIDNTDIANNIFKLQSGEAMTDSGQTNEQKHYKIVYGDTLSEIGLSFSVDYMRIAEHNNIEDPDFILAGNTIKIPLK